VFQFESRGMQGMLRDAKPTRLEDLIALNALVPARARWT
jgi:DNA polymerase-3 subunit alpha